MGKGKICRVHIALAAIFIWSACRICPCLASSPGQFNLNDGEVVFLLDTSISMNRHDGDRLAIDAVRQALYSLPANYQAGLVAYSTDIQATLPLGEAAAAWEEALEGTAYFGYTNAGAALQQAVGMFSGREGVSRYVVILTDGEIDMPSSGEKDFSRSQYEEAARAAREKGIKIYIIAMGSEWNETEIHIFDGAEVTDGAIYWEGQSGGVSEIMNRILYERFQFPGRALGSVYEPGGRTGIDLPAPGAEYARILLLAGQGMPELSVDCEAEGCTVEKGKDFAVIDIARPIRQSVVISYEPTEGQSMEAYMVVGYKAEIGTRVTYRREEEDAGQDAGGTEPRYRHFADIEISLHSLHSLHSPQGTGDGEGSLWDNEYYEGREIPFTVNGVPAMGKIHAGSIGYSMEVEDLQEAVLELDVGGLAEHFELRQPVTILFSLPEYPQPEVAQEPDYRPLWLILGVLTLSLAALLVLGTRKNRKAESHVEQPQAAGEIVKKEEAGSCAFTGKLNIYVLQTPSGEDMPPQVYQLFGRQAARILLSRILDSCGIRAGRIGAADIIFSAGPDKSLVVMDQSESCTVLRGTEILRKGVGYPVYYNGKLTVIFEDGVTEVEIHYKSLKPSERVNI